MKNSKLYNSLDKVAIAFVDCDPILKEYYYQLLNHYPESKFFSCDISINHNEHYRYLQRLVGKGLIVELKLPLLRDNGSFAGVQSKYLYRWDMNYSNIEEKLNEEIKQCPNFP